MRPRKYYVVFTFGQPARVVRGLAAARSYEARLAFGLEQQANDYAAQWDRNREADTVADEERRAWRQYERSFA